MNESDETLHFIDYWRVVSSRKEIVIAVCLLVIVTGLLVTFSMPKVYSSSVVIQVKEETPDVPVFSQDIVRFDPWFLRTQFEIIQSGPVVEEVIRRLNLDEKLGKAFGYYGALGERSFDETFDILSDRIKVQQYRDTNLIEIEVFLEEPKGSAPEVAAEIANMVAVVFREQSVSRTRSAKEEALDAVKVSLEEQEERVRNIEDRVEEIRQKYQISLLSSSTESALPKLNMAELAGQRIRSRMELADAEVVFKKIDGLPDEELLDIAPIIVGDPMLSALVSDKRRSEVELSKLQEAYGPNHPEVVRISASINEISSKIDDALKGLKAGVEAEYEAAKAKYEILDNEVAKLEQSERVAEGRGYREYKRALEDLAHAKRIMNALESRYMQERIELEIPRTNVEIIKPAKAPDITENVSPNFLLNVILSVILGITSGVGLAFFVEYLDTSVKNIEEVEKYMGIPVIGVIPQKVKAFVDSAADKAHLESYRVLRTNIHFSKRLKEGNALCVTSGSVGEGKSLTLFNLGYVSAQLGDNVLIVDSDLHRPRQHKILGVSNEVGLSNILVEGASIDETVMRTEVDNLYFLSSGRGASTHGLLDTEVMRNFVIEAKERFDLVLFDAPPIVGISDALMLVREMDGVILVVQHRKYPRGLSIRAKDQVENMGGNLVGVVLNNINISKDYSYYYYHHYYYYPGGRNKEARKA